MSPAARTAERATALHVADRHGLIRVVGARENNLKDVSVEIPKRRLTVFTGVSGSGKSSLVFDTIAAESQRMINETYSAFVQGFMPSLSRPDVDVLEGLTTAIIVDQQRLGADVRSTVGTVTDVNALLRIIFSRVGQPHIGSAKAYAFNVASISGAGAVTVQRAGNTVKERRSFQVIGGMCPRCEGRGSVTDFDRSALYDEQKSLSEGALTIPGYSMDGWYGRIFAGSGFFDPDKPLRQVHQEGAQRPALPGSRRRSRWTGINLTYEGLIPRIQKSMLSKDPEAMQPHVRAFVDRAVTFATCPECDGTRLSEAARSSKIDGRSIADACAMQISDLAVWVRDAGRSRRWPRCSSRWARPSTRSSRSGWGTCRWTGRRAALSGGEAQRVKMVRHLGSSLTDVTYVFDEPTIGLHPHDIASG
jgi:excinuclease UvrABC ATPase subunit